LFGEVGLGEEVVGGGVGGEGVGQGMPPTKEMVVGDGAEDASGGTLLDIGGMREEGEAGEA
jgi:hypothetical protein